MLDQVGGSRWVALLVATRLLACAVAVGLLAAHQVTDRDGLLTLLAIGWTTVSLALTTRFAAVASAPPAWLVDAGAALALILASGDWRSPFYLLALTTLILPATSLRFRPAVAWGAGFAAAYLTIAVLTERLPEETLQSTIRLETIATHVMVPFVITLLLAYATRVLGRLADERARSERLAIERERQRIAWELHDSAKQRVHAAHLLLTAMPPGDELVGQALAELSAASTEMDNSLSELHRPLDGRPVGLLLRERVAELASASRARIDVRGELPPLPPLVATHVFRVASEALANAVRHASARRIDVVLERDGDALVVRVSDDGDGLPETARPGSHGLRTMHNRARAIGAALDVTSSPDGTTVTLRLPAAPEAQPARRVAAIS